MPTARDLTDPYLEVFTRIPPVGEGICAVCHTVTGEGFDRCWSCAKTMAQVSKPAQRITPISLYRVGQQLHTWLRNYKDGRDDEIRKRLRLRIAATIGQFLANHSDCVAPEGWDVVTSVPSSSGRRGPHSIEQALRLIPSYGDDYEPLLRLGPVAIGHLDADDQGFKAHDEVRGCRVLLVDDTLTSGARVQSAVSALRLSGGEIAAVVCVGRVIDLDPSSKHEEMVERRRQVWE